MRAAQSEPPFSIGNLRQVVRDLQALGLPVESLLPDGPLPGPAECRCLRCHAPLRWCGERCRSCGSAVRGVEFPKEVR